MFATIWKKIWLVCKKEDPMMKVLVTGGSGFLGINMIRYLFNKGIKDIVSLDLAEFDYPERDKVKIIVGDIRDENAVNAAMQGVQIVIHTAAALPLYEKEEIMSTEVKGTQVLVKAAFEHKVDRFVHISSTAVYGVPDHHPIFEDDKKIGVGYYGEAKIFAEDGFFLYLGQGGFGSVFKAKKILWS